MLQILLPKYDRRWLLVTLGLTFLLWAILVGSRVLFFNQRLTLSNLLGFLILSAIISCIIGSLGFFQLRLAFKSALVGLVSGLAAMLYYYLRGGGWEDLIGPLALMECFGLGIILGIVVELIARFLQKLKR